MQATRIIQVGWATSGCERSNRSLAKLSIEISLTRKRVKGGQKRDILRSESILVELTGAPIEKRMLRPVLLLRYKPMIVLSWTTVTVQTYYSPHVHKCCCRNLSYSSSHEQTLDALVTVESTVMLPFQIWHHWGRICQFSCYATNNFKCLRWFDVNYIERRNRSWNLFWTDWTLVSLGENMYKRVLEKLLSYTTPCAEF